VTEFLQRLGEHVGAWLYLIAGGLAFAEAAILVGMVLPGETALLVAGYFCHEGVLNVAVMLPLAIVAAITGDSVGYAFGRRFGPPLRASKPGGWVGEQRWNRVDEFLNRHGGKAVLIGRLTALLRALVPSMSGMARMRYRTFLIWNAVGGVLWAGACVWLGYAFAASLHKIEKYATWAPIPVVVVVVGGWVVLDVRRKRRERSEAARSEAARSEAARSEAARSEAARSEAARAEAQRAEVAQAKAEQLEAEQLEAEQAEAQQAEAQQAKAEQLEAEQLEAEQAEAEQAKAEQAEGAQLEAAQLEAAQAEGAQLEAAQAEGARFEAARFEAARFEAARLEAEQLEAEQAGTRTPALETGQA